MQTLDPKKRRDILKAAEALFAKRPFHEVTLDQVAARAKIGKGTLYIYFRSKEDLYVGLISEAFTQLLERMREHCGRPVAGAGASSMQQLEFLVEELVLFSTARPHMYRLVRTLLPKRCEIEIRPLRGQIVSLLREAIESGIRCGEMRDAHPEMTAQYIMGAMRGVVVFTPDHPDAREVTKHIMQVFGSGLSCTKESQSWHA